LRTQDKAFDAQEAAAALRQQLEEARLEAGEEAAGALVAGALDHTNGAGFQRVRSVSSGDLQGIRCWSASPVRSYICVLHWAPLLAVTRTPT